MKSSGIAVAVTGILLIPAACAQSLIRHDVTELHLKRDAKQPLVSDYVRVVDRGSVMLLQVIVGTDGVPRVAYVVGGFFTPEQGTGGQQLGMRLAFEPRTVDGKPVESTGRVPVLSRAPGNELRDSPALQVSVREVASLIDQRDWTGALAKLDAALANDVRSIAGYCVVEAMRAAVYEASGRPAEALQHITEATSWRYDGNTKGAEQFYLYPKSLVPQALGRRIRLQRALGLYGEALDTVALLDEMKISDKPVGLDDEIAGVRNVVSGNTAISTSMSIDISGKVGIKLLRPFFAVTDLPDGTVSEAWLTCGPRGTTAGRKDFYEVPLNVRTWTLPSTVDGCRIEFTGKPETTFNLLQSSTPIADVAGLSAQ